MPYELRRRQIVTASLERCWDFFSSPANLDMITPPEMCFDIIGAWPEQLSEGLEITYRVSPLFRIPMRWTSVIPDVQAPHFFADEQKHGPYAFWRHEHRFREVDGGVEVADVVHYRMPLEPLTAPIHALIVRPQLERIFDFRRDTVARELGAAPIEIGR